MKVVHIIGGGDVGGAKTHVLSLVAQMSKQIEVLLVSLREGEFADDAVKMGINTRVIRNGNMAKDINDLKTLINEGGFDVIHCHGAKANVIGSRLRKKCNIPVITTVHSDWKLDYMGNPKKQYTFGILNAWALRKLDGYVGVTDNFADMIIDRGFDPYRVQVLYNGLDFNVTPAPKMSKEEFLAQYGIKVSEETVICSIAARLHPVKDIGTIIRALSKIKGTCPKLYFIIGGDGEQMEYLKKLAADLNVSDRVVFAGWVSDMDTFLEATDISLLSSLSESFPYSVLEAIRSGCTMVTSAVGGMPVLIDSGANGFLFTPQDAETLSEHLEYLYKNPDARRDMAKKLYEKASTLYSLDKMVSDQINIYGNVLRRVEADKKKRNMVTICGSYGRGNAGDDAILKAVNKELSKISPDIRLCVMSRNPRETRHNYRVGSIYTFNPFKMIRAMRKSHLYINGGGSLIQDSTSSRSLWFYLFTLRMAKLCGCKVMMYGCGIGPVSGKLNRRMSAKIIDRCADVITLREPESLKELEIMGVKKPKMYLAADPTLNLAPADDAVVQSAFFSEGLDLEGKYVCIAMRKWKNFDKKLPEIARVADYIAKKYGLTPVLVPMERSRDLPIAEAIAEKMETPAKILRGEYDVYTMIGILSKMKLIVAMRLHALVFGAGQGVPVVGISYDEKVSNFMHYIGGELCIEYDELTYDALVSDIDLALSADMSEKLQNATRIIRENERINGACLKEFFNYG